MATIARYIALYHTALSKKIAKHIREKKETNNRRDKTVKTLRRHDKHV